MYKKITMVAALSLIIDQLTKLIVSSQMELFDSVKIIKSFFSITYVKNYGAAWSILEGNRVFLILVAVLAIALIYWMFIKNGKLNKLEIITYGFLIGGILGNLLDRIMHGYVIDFLDFNIFGYNFPIFNFADIFIVLSTSLIVLTLVCEEEK